MLNSQCVILSDEVLSKISLYMYVKEYL
jgi:hypothetical protein